MRVSIVNSRRSFPVSGEQSVLDAALNAALNLPHGCRGGNCGSCRARLIRGDFYYPNGTPLGLSEAEAAEGYILLCQARAQSDLWLELREIRPAEQVTVKHLPCRIESAVPLSHDVMGLLLRLPAAEVFSFEAGQYIDIILSGGRRRSFSIASAPRDARLLELHVRRVVGGEFTERVFNQGIRSALLTLEGPLGQFTYRPCVGRPAPMVFIGGGTGIAPILSILRHIIGSGFERDMTLYWGVRTEDDLYARDALDELARHHGRFHWIPVLSCAPSSSRFRQGFVHQAALEGIDDLETHEVYAAGPPEMIGAIRREFTARGSDAQRLYVDSFDYAPDTLERQRTSAATRS